MKKPNDQNDNQPTPPAPKAAVFKVEPSPELVALLKAGGKIVRVGPKQN